MKDIFSSNVDVEKTAILNWRTYRHEHIYNMIVLAKGYMSSSLITSEQVIEDNWDKKGDILIFPILYNFNHGIELYLKSIIWSLNVLNGTNKQTAKGHILTDLLKEVIKLVSDYEDEKLEKFNELISPLESYINELEKHITGKDHKGNDALRIDFSRYSLDFTNTIPQFYILDSKNVSVDIENLIERFTIISTNLDRLAEHYFYEHAEQ